MSEVFQGISAGNTTKSLQPVDRDAAAGLPSATGLDAIAEEQASSKATEASAGALSTHDISNESDPLDNENTFDVSRAEFTELQDAFLRLSESVLKFNQGSPHKIV